MLRLVHHILVALIDWLSPRTRLTAENLLLRQQLDHPATDGAPSENQPAWERRLRSAVAVRWTSLKDAIPIVKPTTTELDHIVAC